MTSPETVGRIEPTLLDGATAPIADALADLTARASMLGAALHPRTAQQLASLVRVMNSYYSNLIEGHITRPRDIERALSGDLDDDEGRRNLQIEAAAHVRVQAHIDLLCAQGALPDPVSVEFLKGLHAEFYQDAPEAMLLLKGVHHSFGMEPGRFRDKPEHDVEVGRHLPPSSERVAAFMDRFAQRYARDQLGTAGKILAIPAAHHRFNYIHPFPDGNGRVSRLMSHAMIQTAGIGAHGLWSVSRGLARGLGSRQEYKQMMARADTPRQGDLDGRGNLSLAALEEFVLWFLKVCLDQVTFMSSLFDLPNLTGRLRLYVERSGRLKPEAFRLLEEAAIRGEFARGDADRITRLPERTARVVLRQLIDEGLLDSETPKGPVSLRFPTKSLDLLFPQLFPAT
ncbi:MAG: Fic family protein [Gemmatimonadaceae bacterium]|nr:Fic family protein [Caulobacter sp.]